MVLHCQGIPSGELLVRTFIRLTVQYLTHTILDLKLLLQLLNTFIKLKTQFYEVLFHALNTVRKNDSVYNYYPVEF